MKSKPLFLLLALLGLTVMLFGQATDSNLTGTITDPSGAALPGARVELTNEATGVKTSTTTDGNGLYRFNNMPVGRYDVTATAAGFTPGTVKGLDLQLNKSATGNITLQVGAVSATVDVSRGRLDDRYDHGAGAEHLRSDPDRGPADHRECQRPVRRVEPLAAERRRSQ